MMMARSKAATASVAAASFDFTELETLDKAPKRQASVYNLRQQRDADSGKEDISRYALSIKGSIDGPLSILLRREQASA
jgi:hypothetical protein